MFTQRRAYEKFIGDQTQVYFTALLTQHLTGVHYVNLQPSYMVLPGGQEWDGSNYLVRADYEGRFAFGTINALYYFSNQLVESDRTNSLGISYAKTFPYSDKIAGKVSVVGIKNLKNYDSPFLQDVLSVGYSLLF